MVKHQGIDFVMGLLKATYQAYYRIFLRQSLKYFHSLLSRYPSLFPNTHTYTQFAPRTSSPAYTSQRDTTGFG